MNADSRCLTGPVSDVSIKSSFKVPTSQLGPAMEEHCKHAETASDRCSNVGTSLQNDGAESSLHIQHSVNNDGIQDNVANLSVTGKRLIMEDSLLTGGPSMKRKASCDINMDSSIVSELQVFATMDLSSHCVLIL